jgi:hypothetical protein
MTGILDRFYVEHSIYGARVMARSQQLTATCRSDDEIDSHIQLLKDDLDACAKDMKRLVMLNQRGDMFAGWPKIEDEASEG